MRRRMDLVALCTAGDSSDEAAVNQKLSCVASELRAAFSHRNAHKYTKRRATRKHWKQRRTSARKRERERERENGMRPAHRASCILVHRASRVGHQRRIARCIPRTVHRAPPYAPYDIRIVHYTSYAIHDTRRTMHGARYTIHDTRYSRNAVRPKQRRLRRRRASLADACACVLSGMRARISAPARRYINT